MARISGLNRRTFMFRAAAALASPALVGRATLSSARVAHIWRLTGPAKPLYS
jgi:hypothetical protein